MDATFLKYDWIKNMDFEHTSYAHLGYCTLISDPIPNQV